MKRIQEIIQKTNYKDQFTSIESVKLQGHVYPDLFRVKA